MEHHQTDSELLARIDERTLRLIESFEQMKKDYVKQDEFFPIKSIVYGMVSVILLSVVVGLVTLIVK